MKFKIGLLLIILILLLGGCTNNEEALEDVTLKMGILPDDASIPIVVAKEMGYFGNHGLDVELQLFRSAVNRDTAFLADEIQSVSTDVLSLGLFKESNYEVYGVAKTGGSYSLVVCPNSNISEIRELAGQDVGLSLNTLMEYLLDTALKYNDVQPSDINKINIPSIPARMEMLNNNKIDSAALPEPLAATAVTQGAKRLAVNSDFDTYPGILMAKKKYIEANPAILVAFYKGYNKAVDYINTTPQEEYFDIIIEQLSFPENSGNYYKVSKYEYLTLPDNKEIEKGMNWLLEKSLITKKYSYNELVIDIIK